MTSLVPQILYTEDHADTRELVFFVLTRGNCKVTLADTTHQALLLAQANKFDLYLLDNWIPEGSGIELCKKLREFDPITPVLFYSGAAYESDKQEAFASGARGYLTKPVDNDELVNAVFRLISEAKSAIQGKEDIAMLQLTPDRAAEIPDSTANRAAGQASTSDYAESEVAFSTSSIPVPSVFVKAGDNSQKHMHDSNSEPLSFQNPARGILGDRFKH